MIKHFGEGFSVILPITDPYVVHHGALGSFAVIHCPENVDKDEIGRWCASLEGVTEVHLKKEAAIKLQLPEDRLGDLVAISGRDVVLGRTPAHHDLSALKVGLRSHGGRYEEMVPFIFSKPLNSDYHQKGQGDPRNFQVFDYTINGLAD